MASDIVIRNVETLEEAHAVERLQGEVWGMADGDITPLTHLVAVKKAGGQLIGAFDGPTLVGFLYGFVGVEHGETIHHSHLLGVRPAYRNHDIGYRLKLAQRAAVLAQGIRRITWTFDPLQSANAHLNFRKLGATSSSYRINLYGAETSSFLHRLGTDRLWLTWDLDSPRVLQRLSNKPAVAEPPAAAPALVRVAPDGSPEAVELRDGLRARQALIEIPNDFNACGREEPARAARWRDLTRQAFSEALAMGFRVEDFHRVPRGSQCVGVYVLRRETSEALLVTDRTPAVTTASERPTAAAETPLQLERLELREVQMSLRAPFETSFGQTMLRRILVVRAFDASGAVGYGECTAPAEPFFSPETIDTAWHVTTAFIAPLLARKAPSRASEVSAALAQIRDHRMAKAGVETALWDLEAKLAGVPLWRHLGGTQPTIACGVSIGLQPTVEELLALVSLELERGYRRIKIKIRPGHDLRLVEAIRARFPAIALSVDANAAYSLDRDLGLLKQLDAHRLMMIEQPLAAGDLVDHAKLQRELQTPLCLDESIVSPASLRHAHELGACRIVNIKLGRVGGHSEARGIQEVARANALPAWCGGMLESGIGRAHNIAMATLPGFTLPGDISASARYFAEDLVDPPVTVAADGTLTAPTAPGIGYAVDEERLESMTVRREEIEV